jgi:predicted esterase
MRRRVSWLAFVPVAFAVGVGAAYLLQHRSWHSDESPSANIGTTNENAPVVEWCAPKLTAVAGGGCYAAPQSTGALPLVIYLHGIFDKGADAEELDRQRRVAQKGVAAGFAVLALRGTEGACATTPEYATKVCWPSNEQTADKGESFVEAWRPALAAAAKMHPFGKTYVFGFSNGGYFAALIAVRALYRADAFVVARAGSVEPVKAVGPKRPILLLTGSSDPSTEGMQRFDEELSREGWPHEIQSREGGHELPDADIDVALRYFKRAEGQSML